MVPSTSAEPAGPTPHEAHAVFLLSGGTLCVRGVEELDVLEVRAHAILVKLDLFFAALLL